MAYSSAHEMAMTDPNDHFPTRGPVVIGVSAAILAISSIFVGFRLISRFAVVRKPGWDDYTMIVAWMLAFGASFSICYGATKGLGRRQENIPSEWLPPMMQSAYVFSVLYNPALMATKTSILLFYLTLSKTQKVFRWATIATLIVVNVGGLALTILNILQCRPVNAAWASHVPSSASCTNIVTIYLSSAPLNIITDLAIFFLPMPILTSMRLPKKQKIILVITFGFGIFVAAVDVVRIAYLQDAQRETLNTAASQKSVTGNEQRNTGDFAWYASLSYMWSAVEINMGIMCGCVPALKPLVRRFLPSWIIDHSTMRDRTATHTSDEPVLHVDMLDSRQRSDPSTPPASPISKPPPARGGGGGDDDHLGMMDFLTTPDMNEMPQLRPSNTTVTYATTGRTRRQSATFFDFVDTGQKKNITLRSNRESVYPVLMVTILFFVWGFAYGFLDVLNSRFQEVARMSDWQTVGQHSAYYVGYIIGPLTFGRIVFRTWGFKACYMVGLSIYACGTLIFWPSAVLNSFPAFLISNFITGAGLSTLELSANPFIALCGPPEYAEVRLNLSQAVQAIGTIVSPLLAKKVLFPPNTENLIDVQWTYLGISFFNIALAIIYFYVPLPEATDEELEMASQRTVPLAREATINIGSKPVKALWISLGLAVFSQFCYVGGQESTSTSYADYIQRIRPSTDHVAQQAYGHTAFAVSRFLAAAIDIWVKPRFSLLFFYLGAVAFSAAAMKATGSAGTAIIIMVMFFQGPLFPQIFTQGIRGMGKHTKDASVLLTAAIGGGAVFPPIMFAALKIHNAQYAFCVIVAAYAAGSLYPIGLNAVPALKKLSDPVRDEQARGQSEAEEKIRASMGDQKEKRWSKMPGRVNRRKEKDQLPSVEHRERQSWPEGLEPRSGGGSLTIEPVRIRTPSPSSSSSGR
ncbi:MFS monosaccharide transporter-like protein [Cucurbitaria berberidis CBS 394.84]|uniref:MFS monosaccharide transporter-like protein n=1 Tax=Cucurbitaria berberidis CBS 394.84 TaxID=1168544 RepID=A0A9P4GR32_9PLEO|nr:MFS monosaccharide transporter-like protein [Cucurbitaria berberidis CBS 394.84]KAF1849826.1 MFS monosaccharide transporter-like protein [Cucurbitaria berberidis CBS 394.84]